MSPAHLPGRSVAVAGVALVLALACTCGESPTDFNVVHDVGRLCAAWDACEAGRADCEAAYIVEGRRMLSQWGKETAGQLAVADGEGMKALKTMVELSGAAQTSATCERLVAAPTP